MRRAEVVERAQGPIAVFVYGDDERGGGAQRRTLTLVEAFAARGHRVDVVAVRAGPALRSALPPPTSPVRLVELGAWSTRLPGVRSAWRAMVYGSVPALARYLRRERPRALLSAATHINLAGLWAWRMAGAPTRLVLRESNHPPPRLLASRLVGRCYPWADEIIAVSNGVADALAAATGERRPPITTIYNPVVTPEVVRLSQAACDHPWFRPAAPPVILGVGRLVPQKDFATLVRAFARVHAQRPARLVILGPGAAAPLLQLAQQLGVAHAVDCAGFAPNPFAYMARAGVFALSSAWEGLPSVLIEAMACGCPVVSTDCRSGPSEILDHGAFGALVPVGDDHALAAAIARRLDAPPEDAERAQLRDRAAEFAVERAADRYLDVLLR